MYFIKNKNKEVKRKFNLCVFLKNGNYELFVQCRYDKSQYVFKKHCLCNSLLEAWYLLRKP